MRVQPWIDRIRASIPDLREVLGSAELAAVQDSYRSTPSAWVIAIDEVAQDSSLISTTAQRVTARMGVILAVRNARDPRGEAGHDDLETLRDALKTALLGWAPTVEHDPATYVSGSLLKLTDATLWWQDEFQTTFYLRAI